MNALRIKQVATKVGLGQSTLYRMIADGSFPKPFEIMPKRNAWIEEEIDDWLAARAGRQVPPPVARTATDPVAQPLDGESLDELARRIAMRLTPHALWDLAEVAAYLHRSEQHTKQWIVSRDDFPSWIRIPSGKRVAEGARLLWRAKDVIAWAESHVEG
ncbi:AlpA family phage regulatory protein [Burkholderia pseudomallei]|nr:AlpA family phage regulatory protein [Burkholderia pseudomallei]MBO2974542.1 AlpA family phage regulatory protein [Burkholderia pseudomallei]MBO7755616.1 AlpA family phage regulatory protein [Burkholderia pseudomallei]MBO7820536.1 AlpA family phage regulatory protein [Burkholderia pseudomallei]MBO7856393.1 AlpA family phage regulatory protein [Burkholderia pseudomallei]MBO7886431.1 AlpA family phage regulatory protein [Burkholderia pseudomallei]